MDPLLVVLLSKGFYIRLQRLNIKKLLKLVETLPNTTNKLLCSTEVFLHSSDMCNGMPNMRMKIKYISRNLIFKFSVITKARIVCNLIAITER
jgi:hypothetical protein